MMTPTIIIEGCADCPHVSQHPVYTDREYHTQVAYWAWVCTYRGRRKKVAWWGMKQPLPTAHHPHGPLPGWCPLVEKEKAVSNEHP